MATVASWYWTQHIQLQWNLYQLATPCDCSCNLHWLEQGIHPRVPGPKCPGNKINNGSSVTLLPLQHRDVHIQQPHWRRAAAWHLIPDVNNDVNVAYCDVHALVLYNKNYTMTMQPQQQVSTHSTSVPECVPQGNILTVIYTWLRSSFIKDTFPEWFILIMWPQSKKVQVQTFSTQCLHKINYIAFIKTIIKYLPVKYVHNTKCSHLIYQCFYIKINFWLIIYNAEQCRIFKHYTQDNFMDHWLFTNNCKVYYLYIIFLCLFCLNY